MTSPWQVLADCPHCRTEAAVLELMDPLDPGCAAGVPSERRCRLCAWTELRGRPVGAPEDLTDPDRARAALARWAAEDGEPDVDVFCTANLGGDAAHVVALLGRRDPVPTTFDVIAFLFPGAGGGSVGRALDHTPIVDGLPGDAPVEAAPVAAPMDPRTPARLLVSVMVADGTLRSGERTFVLRFLEREGFPPLAPDDLRVWRPAELGPVPEPALRDRLLEAAVHLMHLDRERDGSEWTVVREFARAWGVPEATLAGWDRGYERRYASAMGRLARLLDRVLG